MHAQQMAKVLCGAPWTLFSQVNLLHVPMRVRFQQVLSAERSTRHFSCLCLSLSILLTFSVVLLVFSTSCRDNRRRNARQAVKNQSFSLEQSLVQFQFENVVFLLALFLFQFVFVFHPVLVIILKHNLTLTSDLVTPFLHRGLHSWPSPLYFLFVVILFTLSSTRRSHHNQSDRFLIAVFILTSFSLFSFCCYFCSNCHLLDALITSGHTVSSSRSSFLTFSSSFPFVVILFSFSLSRRSHHNQSDRSFFAVFLQSDNLFFFLLFILVTYLHSNKILIHLINYRSAWYIRPVY